MTRLSRIAPQPRTALLPLIFCLIAWLLGLALSIPFGTKAALHQWAQHINSTTLIALPAPLDGAADLQSAPLLHMLETTFPEAGAHILPAEEVQETLSSWTTAWTGSLPTIIILHVNDDGMTSISKIVQQQSPHAVIIPPPAQKSRLWPFMHSLHHSAIFLAYIVTIGICALLIAFLYSQVQTTCWHTAADRQQLLLLGGDALHLGRIFAQRMSLIALLGSLTGSLLLIPTLAAVTISLRPLLHLPAVDHISELFSPHIFLPVSLIEIVCLIPCLIAAISWGLTLLFYHLATHKTHHPL